MVAHEHEVGVSARCDEAEQGESGIGRGVGDVLQPRGVDVAFEVVDAHQRGLLGEREALRRIHADEERSRESGAVGDGDSVEVAQLDGRLLQGLPDDSVEGEHVLARGDLRNDAAVLGVHLDLGRDDVGVDGPPVLDDGGGRLVAGCLDAEDLHASYVGRWPSRVRTSASRAMPSRISSGLLYP